MKKIKRFLSEGMIRGLGISIQKMTEELKKAIENLKEFSERIVFHTIAGITTEETFNAIEGQKVLILGFKKKGRAKELEIPTLEINKLEKNLPLYLDGKFNLVSFDNLALEQLNVREKVSQEEWNERFMGEEGQFSMYYDSVTNKVFKSSLETKGYYAGKNDIELLFELIKK